MILPLILSLAFQQPAPQPAPQQQPLRNPATVVIPAPVPPAVEAPRNGLDVPNSSATVNTLPIAPTEPGEQPAVPEEEVHVRILDLVEIDGVRRNQLEG